MTIRVGYIIGSLSTTSINRKFLSALSQYAPSDIEMVNIDVSQLPLYAPEFDKEFPAVATDFKNKLASVDAVIVATPQYNQGMSGVVKNAIDWASRPWGSNSFEGKPAAAVAVSIAPHGGAIARKQVEEILQYLKAEVFNETTFAVQHQEERFDSTEISDASLREEVTNFWESFSKSLVHKNA